MSAEFRIVSDVVAGVGPVAVDQPFEFRYTVKNEGDEKREHRHHLEVWEEGNPERVSSNYVAIDALGPGETHLVMVPHHTGLPQAKYSLFISIDCDNVGGSHQHLDSFAIPND